MSDEGGSFVADEAGRLDLAVVRGFPELSRARATALIRDGRVRVDGVEVRKGAASVAVGARIDVEVPPPVPAEAAPQDLPLRIVYRDADLVVVDKDAGMVVHPGAGHHDGTLVNALLHHLDELSGIGGVERPGIVHRLDRGTTGLLVVACNDAAHHHLSEQFQAHTARRRYLAVCQAVVPERAGTVRSSLGRHPTDRVRFASVEPERGKEAVTHWRLRGAGRGLSLMECALETGRTHQIRVHLSEQGWPILGDPLYNGRAAPEGCPVPPERPMLHAWRLELTHPADGRRMVFTAPPPDDLLAVLAWAGIGLPDEVLRSRAG
jgi:23S rRNA pseudouridine1911/1915/1917 synthase